MRQVHAVEVRGLTKTYRGGIEAVREVSFQVAPGEVFGLLGPNGAGKSTTVRILATLTEPTGGSARICGADVAKDAGEVRRIIGYVPQGSGIDTSATGKENLMLQGYLFRLPEEAVRERANELLRLMGLDEVSNRLAHTYSGGMRRRLEIAMSLVHRPEVLFLDEPTAGLDPESRSLVWAELKRLSTEEGLTVLLTTHHMEEADQLVRKLAIIDRGRVATSGTPDALKGELRNDVVSIQVRSDHVTKGTVVLEKLIEVFDVLVENNTMHARVEDGTRAAPVMLDALNRQNIAVHRISARRPSLSEVYLAATGTRPGENNVEVRNPRPYVPAGRSRRGPAA